MKSGLLRFGEGLISVSAAILAICGSSRLLAGDAIFLDAFESGSNCAWSSATHVAAPVLGPGAHPANVPAPPGSMSGSCLGPGGELVFAYTPSVAGTLRVILNDTMDTGFYIRDGCAGGVETLCVDDNGPGVGEVGTLDLEDTATLFLVIDSWTGPGSVTLNLSLCGNNQIEATEACDGSDLGGNNCVSLGFSGGTLACASDCQNFDTSGCFV